MRQPRVGFARALPMCVVLTLLALSGGSALADTACTIAKLAELPAGFDGRLVADVSVNDVPGRFVLGTAFAVTRISRGFAQRLGLGFQQDAVRIASDRGVSAADAVRIASLKIGDLARGAGSLVVMENSSSADQISGIIGVDYLHQVDIELDPLEKKVRLFDRINCPGRSAYWAPDHFELPITAPEGLPIIRISIDGKELNARLNTGSSRSSINYGVARARLDLPDSVQPPPPSHDPEGTESTQDPVYAFKELVFGPITIRNPRFAVHKYAAIGTSTGSHVVTNFAADAPVVIGVDILSKFHSMISLGNGTLYFTLPNERNPPTSAATKP